jgi:phage shock protein PspC (stress-responsive transcriptional regulator)
MLKRIAEAYKIPVAAIVMLSITGLVTFAVVFGIAAYAGLMSVWPDMQPELALVLAFVGPLVFLMGVGVVCAVRDKWFDDPNASKSLKILGWMVPAAVVAYLVFKFVQPLL